MASAARAIGRMRWPPVQSRALRAALRPWLKQGEDLLTMIAPVRYRAVFRPGRLSWARRRAKPPPGSSLGSTVHETDLARPLGLPFADCHPERLDRSLLDRQPDV